MLKSILSDPKHWRNRAKQTRAKADAILRDDQQKQRLFRIAEEYDRLAERAEQASPT
jgi:hypothetical protein